MKKNVVFIFLFFTMAYCFSQISDVKELKFIKSCSCYCLKGNMKPVYDTLNALVDARQMKLRIGLVHELYLKLGTLTLDDSLLDTYRTIHRNSIRLKGSLIHGKENGVWEYYIKDSTNNDCLIASISFENGILDGSYFIFFSNGKIELSGQYKLGVPIGTWTYYNFVGDTLHIDKYP